MMRFLSFTKKVFFFYKELICPCEHALFGTLKLAGSISLKNTNWPLFLLHDQTVPSDPSHSFQAPLIVDFVLLFPWIESGVNVNSKLMYVV